MKYVREHINEKFTQDSDPVNDLGIGIYVFLEKHIKKIGELNDENFFKKYNIVNKFPNYHDTAVVIYRTLINAYEKIPMQEAFINSCKKWDLIGVSQRNGYPVEEIIKFIAEILNVHFGMNIDPNINEKTVNEKFTQDSDPIKDLGIGGIIITDIRDKYREKYKSNQYHGKKLWVKRLRYLIEGKYITGKFTYNKKTVHKTIKVIDVTSMMFGTYICINDDIYIIEGEPYVIRNTK